jgi:P4 family phage/plasmid primase-like protien
MIAKKLHDAGFTELVSVIPPDGVISANSRIDPSQRGKAPGKKGHDGNWYGYGFTKVRIAPEIIDGWGANIGIMGDHFPGLDIDVDDPELAMVIAAQAFKQLGTGPLRTSTGSRLLIPYRTDEPFARMALKIMYKGVEHTVEVLGKGRQYVVHGKHPSGSEYGWEGLPLWEWNVGLDTITKEDVDRFFTHLTEALGERAECKRVGDGTAKEDQAPPQEELIAPNGPALQSLVMSIPNTDEHFPERDDYILMGHAIKGAGGSVEHFMEWTERWEEGTNDPAVVEADWKRMHAPFRVGWQWLQSKARDLAGYQPAQDIFEVDPDALPPDDYDDPPLDGDIDYSDEWAVGKILGRVKQRLRYVPATKTWYVWNDHKWVDQSGSLEHETIIRKLLRTLAINLRSQARACNDEQEKLEKALMASARRLQNMAGIEAVVKLTRARVSVERKDFDTDLWVLNTPGGVVDLHTGEVTSSQKEDMHSRATAVTPKEGKMPLFSKFMRDLTGGDPELIKFLQRYMGYCLTGDVSEKILAFAWGSDSDTGKSTFIRTLSSIFGDYSDSVDAGAFISARTGGRIPDDIARLPGVRLVTATEPSARQSWDEKTIKAITGGDEISARKLYQSWFTYKPQFKILVVGNVQPEIRDVDDAMLRRILIVPMNHKVARANQIEDLSDRMIEEEGPQILHWLVRGCLAWASGGIEPPEAVVAQSTRYKDTQDVLGQWLEEQCELGHDPDNPTAYDTSRRDLFTSWTPEPPAWGSPMHR